jgi:hypothetical protein
MFGYGRRVAHIALGLASSLALVGCGEDDQGRLVQTDEVDVVEIVDTDEIADAVDTTAEDVQSAPCEDEQRGCVGQTPASCVDGAWVGDEDACGGPTPWCLDGTCVVCSPGGVGCGANTPRTCAEDGTWTYAEPCPAEAPLCLDGGCVECSPGQRRCHPTGTSVQRCDENGRWETEGPCDFGCDNALCGGVCVPGAGRCDLDVPARCDVTGTWIPETACAGTTPLCLDGGCVECSPLAIDCDGKDRRACSKNGVWQVEETCPFVCTDGACVGVCEPGTATCDGNTPQRCDETGAWIPATEECAFGCAEGECVGECREGTLRCFGDAPATCSASLRWETGPLCPQPTPDCDLGACLCPPHKELCGDGTLCVDLSNDPQHCGTCGHDCLGGLCENGRCRPIVLATGQASPTGLVVDGDRVYWSNYGSGALGAGSIRSVPKTGGVISLVATGLDGPTALAASDTSLFWTTGNAGNVQTTPKAGGNIVNIAIGMNTPFGIAFGAGTVFFGSSSGSVIYSVSDTGGPVTTLATNQVNPLGLGFDGEWIYWANGHFGNPNSTVMRLRLDGTSAPQVFASNQTRPTAIAFDDTHVYWTVWAGNGADAIRRCPKSGCVGAPQTVVGGLQLSGGSNATCITIDETHLYWTGQASASVHRIPKDGGTPEVLATGQPAANCVKHDATAIYWTNFSGGTVMRLAK